jgi:hypothetical protein
MDKDTTINFGAKLHQKDFDKLLERRKRLIFKFKQLQPEMIFIVKDGHDDFQMKITHVSHENLNFEFIDLSLPETDNLYNVPQASQVLFIPREIYFEDKQFVFRKYEPNTIFQLHNINEFEKSLFDDLHIKSLKTIIDIQKKMIGRLRYELDNRVFDSTPTKKMLNQATQIKYLLKKLNLQQSDIEDVIEKPVSYKNLVNPEDKIQRLSNNVSIWIDKCTKWKQMYFDLLETTSKEKLKNNHNHG